MKRFTRRNKVGEVLPVKQLNLRHEDTTSKELLTEILEALAANDDTGLKPEEMHKAKTLAKWGVRNMEIAPGGAYLLRNRHIAVHPELRFHRPCIAKQNPANKSQVLFKRK